MVGAGRAGKSLALALCRAGWTVDVVEGHDPATLGQASSGVDFVVLAVPDDCISQVATQVHPCPDTVAVHLAGSLGVDVLSGHVRRAVVHPLAPLPEPEIGSRRLASGIFFSHSGDDAAIEIVTALGGRLIALTGQNRAAYHAAACVASNHVVAVLAQAERIGAGAGIGPEPLADLARFSLDDVSVMGSRAALTGPAARGDRATLDRHIRAVGPDEAPGYVAGADLARRLARPERERPERERPERVPAPLMVTSGAELAGLLDQARRGGGTVGFVATMGALHRGHESLIVRARSECDLVVASIFVNPTQFGAGEDLADYPRNPENDTAVAARAGADVVYLPEVDEMYPPGAATVVHVGGPALALESDWRPGHFDGVATVVTRLLATVGQTRAYFGEKDFQQLAVIRRLVSDLGLPATVVACETVRQADGLALSSRNATLSGPEMLAAPALHRALLAGRGAVESGATDPHQVIGVMADAVALEPLLSLDYATVVDPEDLSMPARLAGPLRLLIAARVGGVRLLDNMAATSPLGCPSLDRDPRIRGGV